jgi:hypothetical protein
MGQVMCQSRYDQRGRSPLELGYGLALAIALPGSASERLSLGAEVAPKQRERRSGGRCRLQCRHDDVAVRAAESVLRQSFGGR